MPIEKLGSSSLVSSIFQIERKLHCSLTGRKLWSQVKKCSSHLIYARPCVNKDFVHSGSIGLTQGKHARYVIRDFSQRSLSANNSVIAGVRPHCTRKALPSLRYVSDHFLFDTSVFSLALIFHCSASRHKGEQYSRAWG